MFNFEYGTNSNDTEIKEAYKRWQDALADYIVDNLPFETFKGKDAQIEYAVDYLKKLIKEKPVDVPPAPQHPDKSFKY